jgi:NADPH:quinone reductase-like Zn-dependent oxidoreductase
MAQAGRSKPLRFWEVGEAGGFDTLRLVQRDPAALAAGQVRIQVLASALAGRDLGIAKGWFLNDKPPTLVPVSEGVGRVLEVGAGVGRIKPGDRVVSVHFAGWVDGPWTPANYALDVGNTIDGWLADQVILPESGLVTVPGNVSDFTAATMVGSGITAWHALHEVARVKSGETVLSLGTGGVSTWGLKLAKAAGARVVMTSSSDAKLARMRELGADVTINYRRNPDWGEAVQAQTGGVDVVLENVGRETLDQSMLGCGYNARIVMIGTARLPDQLPTMPGFYIKNLSMKAISNGSQRMMTDMMRAVAANDIEAVVGREFQFDDAVAAFQFMAESSHIGKVVIRHPG